MNRPGMMIRVLSMTLVAALGSASLAAAEETLAQSASRAVKDAVQAQAAPNTARVALAGRPIASQATLWASGAVAPAAAVSAGQEPTVLSKSGMGKAKKTMIYLAVGIGFAASAYAIDHHVVNVTPSSLGTRKD